LEKLNHLTWEDKQCGERKERLAEGREKKTRTKATHWNQVFLKALSLLISPVL